MTKHKGRVSNIIRPGGPWIILPVMHFHRDSEEENAVMDLVYVSLAVVLERAMGIDSKQSFGSLLVNPALLRGAG